MNRFKLSVLMLTVGFGLAACSNSAPESTEEPLVAPGVKITQSRAPLTAEEVSSKWARSCVLCHASGVGGAPRIGVSAEWAPRLAKGKAVLLAHTIDGFNDMPPLGYCMSCDRDDFSALIDFMAGESP